MFVGFARYDLRLAASRSLKDKRSVMRTLGSKLQQKFRCAYAEVAQQDAQQRASVGVSVIAGTSFQARKLLTEIERHVEAHPGVELIGALVDVIAPEDL